MDRKVILISKLCYDQELAALAKKIAKPAFTLFMARISGEPKRRLFRTIIEKFDISQQNYIIGRERSRSNVFGLHNERTANAAEDKLIYSESELTEIEYL